MAFIKAKNLIHQFIRRNEQGEVTGTVTALNGVDLDVQEGQFIAIIGQNGSGKSTFAKHLNVLLSPTEGSLWVDGKDVTDETNTWEIRQSAGMIFQNPDNQIVAGVVEEDVAFGPENLGVPAEEIWTRVAQSLEATGMSAYRYHSPNRLSGGQKQRVAIAGVVAMKPKCIIMDEATAMLDPNGREEVLKTVHRLNREEGVTIILITHDMEEAAGADHIFVMDHGRIAMQGTPVEIFAREEALQQYGLDVPQVTRLANELRAEGMDLPEAVLSCEELADAIGKQVKKESVDSGDRSETGEAAVEDIQWISRPAEKDGGDDVQWIPAEEAGTIAVMDQEKEKQEAGKSRISLEHVSYIYGEGTSYEVQALTDVSLEIHEGEFIGLIGHTGSGKSTLIQLLNGLLRTDRGKICYEGQDIYAPGFSMRTLRGQVGLVFQYPEYQLFETTVLKDVAYGPKNQGLRAEDALEKAKEALLLAGLPEECWELSPFELSGGQKRRAAIAGVLAMTPSVLILDEPAAGLDPRGRKALFSLIRDLHEQMHMTVIMVSHSMEDVAEYVERIIVLNHGGVMLDGTPGEVFSYTDTLKEASLNVPRVTELMAGLRERGIPVDPSVTTISEAKKEIRKLC